VLMNREDRQGAEALLRLPKSFLECAHMFAL
jgi:hypothetical protein